MLMKAFAIIDLIAGLILIFGMGIDFPIKFLLFFGMLLLTKSSLGLLKDFGSWIDFLSGLTFLLLIITSLPGFIGIIFGILLIQKGAFSFL